MTHMYEQKAYLNYFEKKVPTVINPINLIRNAKLKVGQTRTPGYTMY